jgi:hypothetical protein
MGCKPCSDRHHVKVSWTKATKPARTRTTPGNTQAYSLTPTGLAKRPADAQLEQKIRTPVERLCDGQRQHGTPGLPKHPGLPSAVPLKTTAPETKA